jgi:sugar (pentulose or hexulose) kinase
MFDSALRAFGVDVPKSDIYDKLYSSALSAETDCAGLVSYNYFSGEHVTGFTEGRPMLIRTPEARFNVSTLMRSLIYTCMGTLKIGMDILLGEEKVELDKLLAHGGLFKAPVVGQRFLASALNVPVAVMESAGEGGAWGIALLAAYTARENRAQSLADFLDEQVFSRFASSVMQPDKADSEGFAKYMESFRAGLAAQKAAVEAIR